MHSDYDTTIYQALKQVKTCVLFQCWHFERFEVIVPEPFLFLCPAGPTHNKPITEFFVMRTSAASSWPKNTLNVGYWIFNGGISNEKRRAAVIVEEYLMFRSHQSSIIVKAIIRD